MRGKIILILVFTIIIGIQPAFAQSKNEAPAKPAVKEKPVKEKETVININLASDKDFAQALEAAGEVELVNEDSSATNAKDATSDTKGDNTKNQGKSSVKK